MNPLVSIIIPTYNRAHLIRETIESVFNQSYRPVELLIIDNGGSDDTKKVVDSFRETTAGLFVNYVYLEKKGGNAARNTGIELAKGEYLQFFDSDDIMLPGYISIRMNVLTTSQKLDFCGCNWKYFGSGGKPALPASNVNGHAHSLYNHLYHHLLPTPSFLLKKQSIEKIGRWDEKVIRLQDIDYFSRLFYKGLNGCWLDDVLIDIRQHDHNISANNSVEVFQSSTYVYQKIHKECKKSGMLDHGLNQLIGNRILENSTHCYALGYYRYSWISYWKSWKIFRGYQKYHYATLFIRKNLIRILKHFLKH